MPQHLLQLSVLTAHGKPNDSYTVQVYVPRAYIAMRIDSHLFGPLLALVLLLCLRLHALLHQLLDC